MLTRYNEHVKYLQDKMYNFRGILLEVERLAEQAQAKYPLTPKEHIFVRHSKIGGCSMASIETDRSIVKEQQEILEKINQGKKITEDEYGTICRDKKLSSDKQIIGY